LWIFWGKVDQNIVVTYSCETLNILFITENKYSSIGPIYYEYGSMIITYLSSDEAIQACYTLKDAIYEERSLSGWLINICVEN